MKQDEIIEMGVQSGLYSGNPRTPSTGRMIEKRLVAFAKLVAAKERDAIKALAEKELLNTASLMTMPPQSSAAWNILQAIKARGEA